jgi:hypothetical protein
MDRGEYQVVADDRPCLAGQFQVRDLRFFADAWNGHDLGRLRPSRRAVHDGACPTQQRPRTSGSQPGSASSPASAWWPTYSSSGSASWALDVDIGAGVFQQQQTDPLHVDRW